MPFAVVTFSQETNIANLGNSIWGGQILTEKASRVGSMKQRVVAQCAAGGRLKTELNRNGRLGTAILVLRFRNSLFPHRHSVSETSENI